MGPLEQTQVQSRIGYKSYTITARFLKLHIWAPAFVGFGGGIAAFSRELSIALTSLDHQVCLTGKADRTGTFERLPLWGTSRYPGTLRSYAFAAGALLRAARQKPDHIISTHVNFGPVAHLAKRTLAIPYTLVAHGIDIHPGLPHSVVEALRAADHIIAVSSWTRLRVLDLGGIDPSNVSIVPNTFNELRFKPSARPQHLISRYGIRAGEKIILAVGRFAAEERYKGYDKVIRCLDDIRATIGPVRLLLVGNGNDRARIETMAGELGVRDHITFAGFVPDSELADHYRLADVFAMPSTGEGFGIVFLEAMACGLPVVAGNRDGSVDALDGGRLGKLVDPDDLDAICSGIVAVLRGQGPPLWFDQEQLSHAASERFGRRSFRERMANILALKHP